VLDGLRGLAVSAVIVCHVNHAYGGPFTVGRVNGPLAAVFGWAWVGVDLFFVLSGFLITGILFDTKGGDGYFRKFYARRALRIMPLYYGFLLLALVVLPQLPVALCERLRVDGSDAAALALYAYNIRLVFTEHFLVHHHFWSLAVEEHFYLGWPLVVWVLRRRPLLWLCLAGVAASVALRVAVLLSGAWPPAAFFLTPCRLDGLLAGSFVALAWRDEADRARLRRWAGPLLLGSCCLLLGLAIGQGHFIPDLDPRRAPVAGVDSGWVLTVGLPALAVLFASLVVLALGAPAGGRLRRVLENPGLCAVGKYSYGIYVFHGLVLLAVVQLAPSLAGAPAFVARPVAVLAVLGVSFLVAWLSYHLVEKHFLGLKRFFEYREPAAAPLVPSEAGSDSNGKPESQPAGRRPVAAPLPGGAQ
jgi:peptidoglycan/LPS O-acetylase OafA/YrhL